MLILRMEYLLRSAPEAFRIFLGVTVAPVTFENEARGKWYANS